MISILKHWFLNDWRYYGSIRGDWGNGVSCWYHFEYSPYRKTYRLREEGISPEHHPLRFNAIDALSKLNNSAQERKRLFQEVGLN